VKWFDNGKKDMETYYKNGTENGLHVEWRWDNGEKLMEANFKDGDLHGLYRDWHSNGVKLSYSNINGADISGAVLKDAHMNNSK
jgi:antitoxin component YwqK of YwqJK toxin-antitoxin module